MKESHEEREQHMNQDKIDFTCLVRCTSSSLFWGLMMILTSVCISACNRVDWVPIKDIIKPFDVPRLEIEGEVCTTESRDLSYPLRVLFVVDGSESMEVSDPPDPMTEERGRQRAVRETWERLLDQSRGDLQSQIGVIRFSAQSEILTQTTGSSGRVYNFTKDPNKLLNATEKLAFTDRTTNYLNALDTIYSTLRQEAQNAMEGMEGEGQGEGNGPEALSRSRYVVIFISDGLPSDGANNNQGSLQQQVSLKISEILKLKERFGIGEIQLHTLFVSTEQGLLLDRDAQALLQNMARLGKGSYRSFPQGERLNFLHIELSRIKRIYSLKSLVPLMLNSVQSSEQIPSAAEEALSSTELQDLSPYYLDANLDESVSCGEVMSDSDGDGLADLFEYRLGTDPLHKDSDRDGLNDRIEWQQRRSGLSPLDSQDAQCVPLLPVETDPSCTDENQDGFCDCEDADQDGICDVEDYDGDGLNDCEELFFGSSPLNADTDDDGLPDLAEFRFGSAVTQTEKGSDLDWDGTEGLIEVLNGLDPLCDDASIRSRMAYARELEEIGHNEEDVQSTCYRFQVSSIPMISAQIGHASNELLSSQMEAEDQQSADSNTSSTKTAQNRVLLFAGEGAYDEKKNVSVWKMACVDAVWKEKLSIDARMKVDVKPSDFVPLTEFDPDTHCVSVNP